eukprot:5683875-Prymnesium_polylepis.1
MGRGTRLLLLALLARPCLAPVAPMQLELTPEERRVQRRRLLWLLVTQCVELTACLELRPLARCPVEQLLG